MGFDIASVVDLTADASSACGLRAVAVATGTGEPPSCHQALWTLYSNWRHWRGVEAATWTKSLASCCAQGS